MTKSRKAINAARWRAAKKVRCANDCTHSYIQAELEELEAQLASAKATIKSLTHETKKAAVQRAEHEHRIADLTVSRDMWVERARCMSKRAVRDTHLSDALLATRH